MVDIRSDPDAIDEVWLTEMLTESGAAYGPQTT